jgi:hypothetical protein
MDYGTMAGSIQTAADYIMNENPFSDEAAAIRDSFIVRWDNLGWTDKTFPSQELYDEIMNRQNQFWIANRAAEERATAARIVRENRSDPRQTSGGILPGDERLKDVEHPDIEALEEQIEAAKPLFELPTWFKGGVIVALLGGAALGIAKIVTGLNPMALAAKFAARKGG